MQKKEKRSEQWKEMDMVIQDSEQKRGIKRPRSGQRQPMSELLIE